LRILVRAREETGLPIVTEVVNPRDIELVEKYADMLQIGARNMQNFTLLREVGHVTKAGSSEAGSGCHCRGMADGC
jgi:3-deoxy-7-phosphoheptulonate synthase